jgi:C-terminal processing protease CtpA/Prc
LAKLLIAAAVASLLPQLTFAQNLPSQDSRLLATGKLWTTVKYFHPYLAYRDIDWDKALVDALPKIRSAATPAEYAAAIQSMLKALKDPATHTGPPAASAEPGASAQRTWIHRGLPNPAFLIRSGGETETITIPLGGGVEATVRLSEPATSAAAPAPPPDRAYADAGYPTVEYRILAAYKVWAVFHYFFAYRDLMDEDWDDLLPVYLPKFIAAKDAREYNLTIAELLTHVADSHASVESKTLAEYFGVASPGLRLRLIEKQPVITQVLDPEAVKAGVHPGDIVKRVDGETIFDRFKRQAQYVAASTPQALGAAVITHILNGPEASTAALTLEDATGSRKEVSVRRSTSFFNSPVMQRGGEAVKLLPGSIGYVDLERLKAADVDGIFEKFRAAKAIVFDGRGPADNIAGELAGRLTEERDAPAAVFTGPLTMNPDVPRSGMATHTASYFFVQSIPNSSQWKYKNKTVMLVDERTIDQAEHIGLFLEAANKTAFIGLPSAGADGDVNEFAVPGGVTIRFSARDVRHANGGKLQRLGLQPSVSASPTIKGVRDGRDEVLDKTLEYLAKPE